LRAEDVVLKYNNNSISSVGDLPADSPSIRGRLEVWRNQRNATLNVP